MPDLEEVTESTPAVLIFAFYCDDGVVVARHGILHRVLHYLSTPRGPLLRHRSASGKMLRVVARIAFT